MKAALLIIDMQNDFFRHERLKERKQFLCDSINALAKAAREKKIPVIWIRQEFKADLSDGFLIMKKKGISMAIEHTEGARLLSGLEIEKSDFHIIKKRYSAFYNTTLEELLASTEADTLIFAGVNTHACVRTSVIDAYQRDFEIILVTDCTDSYDEAHHTISLRYLTEAMAQPMTNSQIFSLLSNLLTHF